MRYRLLLQQEADGLLLPEQAVVAEAAKFSNWYESASQFLYRPCGKTGAKELDKYILSPTTLTDISEVGTAPAEAGIEDIPIGSIEFVETFLSSRYGIDRSHSSRNSSDNSTHGSNDHGDRSNDSVRSSVESSANGRSCGNYRSNYRSNSSVD